MAGSSPLVMGFADTFLALVSEDERVLGHITGRYGAFAAREESPPYSLNIGIDSSLDQADPNTIDVKTAGESLSASSSSLKLEYDFTDGGGSGRLSIAPQELFIDIENSLRILVSHLVLRRDMLLVHAAAFGEENSDRVGIFAGQSGAGKTTISNLAGEAGLEVFSDDMVLLAPRSYRDELTTTQELTAWPTPLGSLEGPKPEPVKPRPVSHIFFLEHGKENSFSLLDVPDAYMRLLTVVPFTQIDHAGVKQRVLTVALQVDGCVRSSVFSFVPDTSAPLRAMEQMSR
ncbi:MAG: hypothetical protein E3J72_20460 [Planctomycetota bacterium]|nr:MAG: hypothetical protein E3J72_20460 [Planctomycetota bacterium]